MTKKEPTVRELFEIVRRGKVWRGQSIETVPNRYSTAELWIKEDDITQGIFAVKSSAIYDNYVKWCKNRGISNKSTLSLSELGKFLTKTFKSTKQHNSNYYYINKELEENLEEKKKRQEKHTVKKKKENSTDKEKAT